MLKKLTYAAIFILLIGSILAYFGYSAIWKDNVNDDHSLDVLQIPSGSSFDDVANILEQNKVLISNASFRQVAKIMNYQKPLVPAGRYQIDKSWSNRQLISCLRAGDQKPIKVTFNNHRNIEETVGHISSYLEVDSLALLNYVLASSTLDKLGLSKETVLSIFIPDTYQLLWNSSPEKIVNRMVAESNRFWNKGDRIEKLKKSGLTKEEVYTLASIVEKESQVSKERPIIAGLYLNRLKKNIPLQADPTVVFGVGDFTIRRVLNKHLAHNSPYNTYMYGGLPPGPIYLPSIESLDAVLNPAKHDYLFMCAKPGYNSEHSFAKTAAQHSRNATKYRNWLNTEGIRR